MNTSDFHAPTQTEIEAHILAARKQRAEAFAQMTTAALRWLTHPRFGLRHA